MADTRKVGSMKPNVHEVADYAQACLKLAELICERFGGYDPDILIVDALPVRRTSDGKRIATAVVAYPPNHSERAVGCMWPPVTELA